MVFRASHSILIDILVDRSEVSLQKLNVNRFNSAYNQTNVLLAFALLAVDVG